MPAKLRNIAGSSNCEDLSTGLSSDGKMIVSAMTKKFDELKCDFDRMKTEFHSLLALKSEEIIKLSDEVLSLRNKVSNLENTLDEEDAYIRRETLIFSGTALPIATGGEICSNIVHQLVRDKLQIQLREGDISVAHRLGKKPSTQGPDTRSIIVKLCRSDTKREILMAKRNHSDRSFTLFINESLTPRRRTILFALRQMKRAHPTLVTGCSSMDGRVYAYTKPDLVTDPNSRPRNIRHLVNTHEKLVEFCRHFVKKPLDSFLDSWNH